jgi:hypothetical protein
MSATLFLRWLTPVFALAVAATIWILAGPLAAGLALVTFLLGVATAELHHVRWSPVDAAAHAASDSAFLALLEAERGGGQVVAAPPEAPKRNYRATRRELAIGSGEIRLELEERLRLHVAARVRPKPQPKAPPPVSTEAAQAFAQFEAVAPPPPARPALSEAVEPDRLVFRSSFIERVSG